MSDKVGTGTLYKYNIESTYARKKCMTPTPLVLNASPNVTTP